MISLLYEKKDTRKEKRTPEKRTPRMKRKDVYMALESTITFKLKKTDFFH